MIVSLRVFIFVLFVDFCLTKDVTFFPGSIRNRQNLFAISTPLPADQVVAQALVEEVSDDNDSTETLDNSEKETKVNNNEELNNFNSKQEDVTGTTKTIKNVNPSETKKRSKTITNKDHDKIQEVKKQYKGKKGHKSAKFGEKKGHKKGHNTKGYNNRFHKDEYHKEHKLYGDAYKDQRKNLYKDANTQHTQKGGGYNKSKKKIHSHSNNKFGKIGDDDESKFDDHHEDFNTKSGHLNKNIHHSRQIKIKDETNPYPNHRPY